MNIHHRSPILAFAACFGLVCLLSGQSGRAQRQSLHAQTVPHTRPDKNVPPLSSGEKRDVQDGFTQPLEGASLMPPGDPSEADYTNKFVGDKQHGYAVVQLVRGDVRRKEVALTFDDGPHPPFTEKLLDLLKQLNVKATFFVVGRKADVAPELLARMLLEGHDVANHTYHHINMKSIPLGLVENEIRLNNDAIQRACGHAPVFFRPPGGQRNGEVVQIAHRLGLTTVLWTDDPADYAKPGAEVIEQRLLGHITNGATILLHDGVEQTYQMLPDFVARLRSRGYKFVTVTEMTQHLAASHAGK